MMYLIKWIFLFLVVFCLEGGLALQNGASKNRFSLKFSGANLASLPAKIKLEANYEPTIGIPLITAALNFNVLAGGFQKRISKEEIEISLDGQSYVSSISATTGFLGLYKLKSFQFNVGSFAVHVSGGSSVAMPSRYFKIESSENSYKLSGLSFLVDPFLAIPGFDKITNFEFDLQNVKASQELRFDVFWQKYGWKWSSFKKLSNVWFDPKTRALFIPDLSFDLFVFPETKLILPLSVDMNKIKGNLEMIFLQAVDEESAWLLTEKVIKAEEWSLLKKKAEPTKISYETQMGAEDIVGVKLNFDSEIKAGFLFFAFQRPGDEYFALTRLHIHRQTEDGFKKLQP